MKSKNNDFKPKTRKEYLTILVLVFLVGFTASGAAITTIKNKSINNYKSTIDSLVDANTQQVIEINKLNRELEPYREAAARERVCSLSSVECIGGVVP